MDDYLTIFDNRSNGVTKFESVQSRFDRLHIPRKDVQWILCESCGSLVNRVLYDNHIVQHEFINLAYSMCHFELAEEKKMLKISQRIQRKEKRRQRKNHSLVGLDAEEDTDASDSDSSASSSSDGSSEDSSDSASGDDNDDTEQFTAHSLPGCSSSVAVQQPQKRKKTQRKVTAVKREAKTGEGKGQKKRAAGKKRTTNGKATAPSVLVGVVKRENAEPKRRGWSTTEMAWDGDEALDIGKTAEECGDGTVPTVAGGAARGKRTAQQQKTEMVEQTEEEQHKREAEEEQKRAEAKERNQRNRAANRKRRLRAVVEEQMMRRHLGPNHHRVFVDNSIALDTFFDRRTGQLSLDALRSPPQQLRRSRRGATDGEELQCLL
ncbi:hypothetical protein niasHT_009325 [Heterodera trifolii]|uniref:Uncharacterized protein n=1 Tax=Heterodera trifolii TaxID=157864 RepID=A0ABD2LU33_9BILA